MVFPHLNAISIESGLALPLTHLRQDLSHDPNNEINPPGIQEHVPNGERAREACRVKSPWFGNGNSSNKLRCVQSCSDWEMLCILPFESQHPLRRRCYE